ncbi:MAG: 6-phosphogluconolactonase [Planctomycetota bacterium]
MTEAFSLEPEIPAPPLPGTVVVREDIDAVVDAAAADLMFQAVACVRAFGDFHIALSGGSTPAPLYRRLMYDPNFRDLPWKRTHLWIVDERRVPFGDEKSNFGMIREWIVEHSDIPADQVHPMTPYTRDEETGELRQAAHPDVSYEAELREHLGWRPKGHDRLDYVLLGMGDDGHTASLFPNSRGLHVRDRLAVLNDGEGVVPPPRITMTFDLINAARLIAVMVTGERKRSMLDRVARGDGSVSELPILGVRPLGGEMRWYLDRDACPLPSGA